MAYVGVVADISRPRDRRAIEALGSPKEKGALGQT
jgi:hypothetical protein